MSLPSTTKQFILPELGSYKTLALNEAPVPKIRASEVLVKVHAVSLQYRDIMVSKGIYGADIPKNLVPGSDMAGEILAIGEDVTGWKVGDRVCANFSSGHIYGATTPAIKNTSLGGPVHGVLTQYRSFPANSLVAIPEHLSFEEASTLPCAALTAYNALHGPIPVKAGDTVLVLGTGGVSIFALQLGVAAGATVIATSSSDEKLQIASKLGAKHVINYKKTPNWDEEVLKVTNGVGVDHVIEVGGAGTLAKSINSAKVGSGYVNIIGHVSSDEGNTDVVFPLIQGAKSLRGIYVGSVSQFIEMTHVLSANPEVTRPLVDKIFPFDKTIEAYEYLESQKHVGKVVIKVA